MKHLACMAALFGLASLQAPTESEEKQIGLFHTKWFWARPPEGTKRSYYSLSLVINSSHRSLPGGRGVEGGTEKWPPPIRHRGLEQRQAK